MKRTAFSNETVRTVSRMMLGLVLFLLFAAHVALPCVAAAQIPRFSPQGGMCRQHALFQADVDVNGLFKIPVPQPTQVPFLPLLAVFFAMPALAVLPAAIDRQRRFPGHRMRGRPFVTSDLTFLPAFAAQRDA